MRRNLLLALACLLFFSGCEPSYFVDVRLESSHPWERASGRQFWYTLVHTGTSGLEMNNIPIGVHDIRLAVPRSRTVIFAAYPLGTGFPVGGGMTTGTSEGPILLTSLEGPLGNMLLQVAKQWPAVVSHIDFDRLSDAVRQADERMLCIDWNRVAASIVNGTLGESSIQSIETRTVELSDIPEGSWVSESPMIRSFTLYGKDTVTLDSLPPGMIRFVNLQGRMELRVLVPDDETEAPFWYIAPLDPILAISDPAYHDLIRSADDFP
ncbi:MAG: hypothetical protein WCY74_04725 [Sphaerochaetaceae bacterium]